jgi:hypothetical protein
MEEEGGRVFMIKDPASYNFSLNSLGIEIPQKRRFII